MLRQDVILCSAGLVGVLGALVLRLCGVDWAALPLLHLPTTGAALLSRRSAPALARSPVAD